MAAQPGQPSRPEIGPPPRLADALLLGRRRATRRSMRPRAAIKRPPARRAVGRRRLPPAPPPPMRGRRRDVQTGRGLPERRAVTDELDQRHATCRSERRPMVLTHPGPPPPGVLADTKRLRTGPDVFTQPFTRSPDRSPRAGHNEREAGDQLADGDARTFAPSTRGRARRDDSDPANPPAASAALPPDSANSATRGHLGRRDADRTE